MIQYGQIRKLRIDEVKKVNGSGDCSGNGSLSATVIRNAGLGAIGGALRGPETALAGAILGAMIGFSNYYESNCA